MPTGPRCLWTPVDNKLSLILTACLLPSGEKDNAVEVAELDGLGLEQLKSTWGDRFGKIAKQSLKESEVMLDFDQIDRKDLIDEGIRATASIAEQKIRQKKK
ncbi:hypothetical protein BD770DRAFT_405540 [Pilaira anomala]|nr:hypothetical protein BD770DRAFT_405540 [Pilaira anomala]